MRKAADAFQDPAVRSYLCVSTVDKDTQIFIEIYRRLRNLIEQGVLKSGDPLPSESALAQIMCVGRTSLRTALSILYEDGYVATIRGKGSYVADSKRPEKYRRLFPEGLFLAPERMQLLGPVEVAHSLCNYVHEDGFLTEKLSPGPSAEIIQFQQLYHMDQKPAVYSLNYFTDELCPVKPTDPPGEIYTAMAQTLKHKVRAVEYECIPVRPNQSNGLRKFFNTDMLTMVASTYVGDGKVIAFCKDYYNSEIMRFRFAISNL